MGTRPDAEQIYREYLTAIVLHGQAVADATGLPATDAYAMNVLGVHGALSAGELAARTGLTSGAATRLIDRLVRAGVARRVADPADRRRVLVETVPGSPLSPAADALVEAARDRMGRVFSGYDVAELEMLFEFFVRSTKAYLAAANDITAGSATHDSAAADDEAAVPPEGPGHRRFGTSSRQ